jgi:shikimate dehydrogenase
VKRLGVLGWPVAHSRSPAMHRAALEAVGLHRDWHYQKLPVPPEVFAETVKALAQAGFHGANVTIPHKEAALALADEATDRARAIGAANTLTFTGGAIHADNTDAPGLIAALPRVPATAMVLGAGGSARAVVWALRQEGVDVSVWNRTRERAEQLGGKVVDAAVPAELLVNCTSVGLDAAASTFKHLPLTADLVREYACVADLVYRPGGTELIQVAETHGCAVVDGLEILVRQGAFSFEIWTGIEAPLDALRQGARGNLPEQLPKSTR